MQTLKSICRIVQGVYSLFQSYICTPHFADAGILTPCRNAIYHAYTCICMFEIMHVSIYYAYTCIYMQ